MGGGCSIISRYDIGRNNVFGTVSLKTSAITNERELQHVPTQRDVERI